MEQYTWAINPIKLNIAVSKAPAMFGPKFTEDNVKEIYVSLGGLLSVNQNKAMEEETIVEASTEEVVDVAGEPAETVEVETIDAE